VDPLRHMRGQGGLKSMQYSDRDFPSVYWEAMGATAEFLPGDELPPASEGHIWAVLVFLFYGDKIVLADIAGRGYCIPSGKVEQGETISVAAEREVFEEVGGRLKEDALWLIGCYKLTSKSRADRYCAVFVAEALGFEPIPAGSESQGKMLSAIEDVADLYFQWDPLMDAVFAYAEKQRQALFRDGISLSDFTS